ncbi:MAG TPA: response regulator [Methanoregulaceae archaeon]|nr:response regulator [Methanoregulaceae archaeon]
MLTMISLLVVDDEAAFLDLCKLYLERSGQFTVTTMVSARQALRIMEDRQFDAIVSDYLMPEMDGIEFLSHIREKHGHIPFIILTGRGNEDVAIGAMNKGADYYLQKTGHFREQFAELEFKIREAVRRSRAEEGYRESSSILAAVMESSPDGILVTGIDGSILDYNSKIKEIWNIPENILELGEENAFLAFVFKKVKDPSGMLQMVRDLTEDPLRESADILECKDGKILERYSCPFLAGDIVLGRVWRFSDYAGQLTVRKSMAGEENPATRKAVYGNPGKKPGRKDNQGGSR